MTSTLGPLPGTLTLPAGHGPFPAVLLIAGSGPSDRDETIGPNKPLRDLAHGLVAAGIASLRYDRRTLVFPTRVAAALKAGKDFTIDDEVTDDALAALKLLARQPGIDPQRMFVLGHSLGALMAPRLGQRYPGLAGLVLLAAPVSFNLDSAIRQIRYIGQQQGISTAEITAQLAPLIQARAALARVDAAHPSGARLYFHAPASYWLGLRDYNAVRVAEHLSVPMLVLQVEATIRSRRRMILRSGRQRFHRAGQFGCRGIPASATCSCRQARYLDLRITPDLATWTQR